MEFESTRIAEVQAEKVWENILLKNNINSQNKDSFYDFEKYQSKIIKSEPKSYISWKGRILLTTVEQNWKIEKISFKKTKLTSIRKYSNPFYILGKFFIKKPIQRKLDKFLEEIILASL